MIHGIFQKWTIHKLRIWQPIKTSAFSLSWVTVQKFWHIYFEQFPSLSRAHTDCVMIPSFTCSGGRTQHNLPVALYYILEPWRQRVSWWPVMTFPVLTLLPGYPTHTKNRASWNSPPLDQTTNQLLWRPPPHMPSTCFVFHTDQQKL
jgi:hypothetical protein